MSSAPKTTDGSILRKFEASKKEEDLKKRLFQKKNFSNQNSPAKPPTISKATTSKADSQKKEEKPVTSKQPLINVPEKAVDTFLKEMENEFKELNKSKKVL